MALDNGIVHEACDNEARKTEFYGSYQFGEWRSKLTLLEATVEFQKDFVKSRNGRPLS